MAACQNNTRCMRPGMEYSNRQGIHQMPFHMEHRSECHNDNTMSRMGEHRKSCGCETTHRTSPCNNDALSELPIAMAYVPWQKWRNICELGKAFQNGTIFEELNKPFCGKGGVRR